MGGGGGMALSPEHEVSEDQAKGKGLAVLVPVLAQGLHKGRCPHKYKQVHRALEESLLRLAEGLELRLELRLG